MRIKINPSRSADITIRSRLRNVPDGKWSGDLMSDYTNTYPRGTSLKNYTRMVDYWASEIEAHNKGLTSDDRLDPENIYVISYTPIESFGNLGLFQSSDIDRVREIQLRICNVFESCSIGCPLWVNGECVCQRLRNIMVDHYTGEELMDYGD